MATIKLISLGCSKNTVDSEVILGNLKLEGWKVIPETSPRGADVTIINTCGFILDAKQESIDTILKEVARKKRREKRSGNGGKLIVMGCLVQRYGEELRREIPGVDDWIGVNDLPAVLWSAGLPARVLRVQGARAKECGPGGPHAIGGGVVGPRAIDVTTRHLTTPSHYAYLKISEGCNRQCAFCAIPGIRGRHHSRPEEEILREARKLAENGVKELILVAQDLCSYGIDLPGHKPVIAALVRKLCRIDGLHWIRLQYLYPHAFPGDLLKAMAEDPKVCKYVDIPLQHINTGVLKSMLRATTRSETLRLLHRFKKALPEDAAFRTTLIAGFPTEGEKEYGELLQFIQEFRFDRLGVFPYSPEENTPAEKLGAPVPQEEKERRAQELMDIQEGISLELNRRRVGKVYEVLIDREEGEFFVGRTQYDSPEVDNEVLIFREEGMRAGGPHAMDGARAGGPCSIKIGEFYRVRIESAEAFDLYGRIVGRD